jgi:hypothetical protein
MLSKNAYNNESFCYSGKPQFTPYRADYDPPEFSKSLWNG